MNVSALQEIQAEVEGYELALAQYRLALSCKFNWRT